MMRILSDTGSYFNLSCWTETRVTGQESILACDRSAILVLLLALCSFPAFANEKSIPTFAQVKATYIPSESWLLDRNGEVIATRRMDSKVRRLEWLPLDELSPAIKETLIAAEDKRFYQHTGVDWQALLAATWSNVWRYRDGKRPRGASTLTMQLTGFLDPALSLAGPGRSLVQKWNQIKAAGEIEKNWSKQEILEAYLNLAPFRGELVGIHAISFALYGKHPSALNRSESLLLMALLKGPQAKSGQVAIRACAIMANLPDEKNPSCAELRALASTTFNSSNYALPANNTTPHLALKLLNKPGVRVSTTLDAKLQRYAIQSLRENLGALDGRNVEDGALIVIDNNSGEVLAYVGSSGEFSAAPDVDGVQALRQAGSTLKPLLYGLAIEGRLLTAASVLDDSPIQLTTPSGLYIPQNYDHDFKGPVSVRTALASSLNVPAVRTMGLVGTEPFVQRLRLFGLDSLTRDGEFYGLGLALGGAEVRLAQLTNAYRALANQGIWHPIHYTPDGGSNLARRALSNAATFIVADILADNGARALTFGLDNPLATRVWTAVKTGTSKDMRDNWCIGFSARYTVGVWVGNFGGKPMRDVSGITGAAPIWRDLIDYLHANLKSPNPQAPKGLIEQEVRFTPEIEAARKEWFVLGTETQEIQINTAGSADLPPKILNPTNGTIIAIDPDIPSSNQRIRLHAQGEEYVTWLIDGTPSGNGALIWWPPISGHHTLTLIDLKGNELDAIAFEVRGDY